MSGETQAPSPAVAKRSPETVLVVDDDAAVRGAVGRILRRHGYTVLEAGDGESAMAAIQVAGGPVPDLVIADMVMPRMGGEEFVAALRAVSPDIRVLLTSGYSAATFPAQVRTAEGVAFIEKPFNTNSLLEAMRGLLEQKK
jgi:DNA-binding NtrC family response regulator